MKHIDIEYKLEYELVKGSNERISFIEIKSNIEQLRAAVLEFSQFYAYISPTYKQNDPILPVLNRIIDEEHQICIGKGSRCLNSRI